MDPNEVPPTSEEGETVRKRRSTVKLLDRVAGRTYRARMLDYRSIEQELSSQLGLTRRPIAIAFRDTPPSGVAKFEGSVPSGCSFWRLASEGRTFFTVPSDHHNCAIGAYT